MRTRGEVRGLFGGGQGAAPLEAQAVWTKAPAFHTQAGRTDRDALFEPQRASVMQVVLVAFVERDDESQAPALSGQTKESQSIVSCIEGGGLDGEAESFAGVIEVGEAVDTVVAVAVSQGDEERQLATMLETVGCEFVDTVTIDPAFAVAIPAPEGMGIVVSA